MSVPAVTGLLGALFVAYLLGRYALTGDCGCGGRAGRIRSWLGAA